MGHGGRLSRAMAIVQMMFHIIMHLRNISSAKDECLCEEKD